MIYGNSNWNKFLDSYLEGFFSNRNYPMYLKVSTSTPEWDNYSKDELEKNQTSDGEYLMIEVPGFNKSNLKVELEGDKLFVSGKRTYKVNGEETTRTYFKTFNMGGVFDGSQIEATVEDGILTVFIPNKTKSEKKKISIL